MLCLVIMSVIVSDDFGNEFGNNIGNMFGDGLSCFFVMILWWCRNDCCGDFRTDCGNDIW